MRHGGGLRRDSCDGGGGLAFPASADEPVTSEPALATGATQGDSNKATAIASADVSDVTPENAVAKVGEVYYDNLESAFMNAKGKTIDVLKDASLSGTYDFTGLSDAVTINLNGHTVSGSSTLRLGGMVVSSLNGPGTIMANIGVFSAKFSAPLIIKGNVSVSSNASLYVEGSGIFRVEGDIGNFVGASISDGVTVVCTGTNNETDITDKVITNPKTISYGVFPAGSGTVAVSGQKVVVDVEGSAITQGEKQVTLTATPANGYQFVRWEESGSPASTNATYTFIVQNDRTLTAVFEPATYTVTLNANEGTINDGDVTSYTYGTGATLPTNVTKAGYTFMGWYGNAGLSGSPVTTISTTDTGNKEYWAKWLSSATGVTSVKVGETAGTINGTSVSIVLPHGTSMPADSNAFSIIAAAGATVSGPTRVKEDDGSKWTFTVTAADGATTKTYTIQISVADDPAADNKEAVSAAKTIVAKHDWTVPQSEANTQESVEAWVETQLATLLGNSTQRAADSITATVARGTFTEAAAGTAGNPKGTDGSFSFTVTLEKGVGTGDDATSTYAKETATINGTITATPYTPTPPSPSPSPAYQGIRIASGPDKTEYTVGEELGLTGLVVREQWSDGSGRRLAADEYEVSGFDSSEPGERKVTVALKRDKRYSASFTVTVAAKDVVVHRLYNSVSGEHLYTANEAERDHLASIGWRYEGVAFTMSSYGAPVHRLYLPGGMHLFTASEAEYEHLKATGWRDEGIAWWEPTSGSTEVHRLYNTVAGDHLLTASEAEYAQVRQRLGWRDEGVAFNAD